MGLIGSASGANESSLVGTWATSSSLGELVDRGSGTSIQSAYTGQAYRFRQDGTYWYLIVGSGTLSSGAAVQEGDYKVNGSLLTLRSKTESWTPNPNKPGQPAAYRNKQIIEVTRYELDLTDPNTLHLTEVPYGTRSTFHRTRASQQAPP